MRSNADHDGTPLDELAAAITTGAVRLAAATAAWLRLVAEFDRRGGWHGVGIRSCAHWLAWQCGLGTGAAREHVRVARALPGLPRIQAAFSAGRLSYSKVRALTRIAAPDCEAMLVEFALFATAAQTERFCCQWRRADDAAAGTSQPDAVDLQSFQHWYDDDGFLTLKIRLPAVEGAALMARIEARAERDARRERAQSKKAVVTHATIRAAGGSIDPEVEERCAEDAEVRRVRERTAARRITALSDLVESGAAVERRRPGDPPRREVVVHVDAAVLADDTAAGRAHVEGGPAITGAQARRILCEATVVAMLEKGREPLAVGRRRRRATKAQWRALLRRDEGCARPGCPETRVERLHAHHMRHWLFGGPTDIDNLVSLCDVDHGLVHEHDLVMSRRDGRLVVTAPDGSRVWGSADAAFVDGIDGASPDPAAGEDDAQLAEPRHGTSVDPTRRRRVHRRRTSLAPARPAGQKTSGTHPSRARRPVERPLGAESAPGLRSTAGGQLSVAAEFERLDRVLFPDGAPPRPAPRDAPYERLHLDWALGILMGNRDLVRRLEHERAPHR
jgi:hypothetical protein